MDTLQPVRLRVLVVTTTTLPIQADQEQFHLEQGPYGHNLRRRRSGEHKELHDTDQCDDDRPPNLKRVSAPNILSLEIFPIKCFADRG